MSDDAKTVPLKLNCEVIGTCEVIRSDIESGFELRALIDDRLITKEQRMLFIGYIPEHYSMVIKPIPANPAFDLDNPPAWVHMDRSH
jgi:hypothetical protein